MYIHGIYMMYTMFMNVCISLYLYFQLCCLQDTILGVPPYPYCIEELSQDVLLEDCWYAHLQLLFTCYLCLTGGRPPKNASYRCCPDDLSNHRDMVTFEELKLPISWPMESAGMTKLYEPFPTQLHACMWLQLRAWWAEFH
jgi:hypothetical protein